MGTGKHRRGIVAGIVAVLGILCCLAIAGIALLGPRYGIYLLPPSPQQYVSDALDRMDLGIYASGDTWLLDTMGDGAA